MTIATRLRALEQRISGSSHRSVYDLSDRELERICNIPPGLTEKEEKQFLLDLSRQPTARNHAS